MQQHDARRPAVEPQRRDVGRPSPADRHPHRRLLPRHGRAAGSRADLRRVRHIHARGRQPAPSDRTHAPAAFFMVAVVATTTAWSASGPSLSPLCVSSSVCGQYGADVRHLEARRPSVRLPARDDCPPAEHADVYAGPLELAELDELAAERRRRHVRQALDRRRRQCAHQLRSEKQRQTDRQRYTCR